MSERSADAVGQTGDLDPTEVDESGVAGADVVPPPEALAAAAAESDGHAAPATPEPKPLTILVYASDRTTRENVRFALGRKIAADLPPVRVLEVATQPALLTAMDAGGIDLAVLDGEAVPGGMGLCRQLKDEILSCPPLLVLTGRRDDAWLATWSRADGVVAHPIDPVRLPATAAELLRPRTGGHELARRG